MKRLTINQVARANLRVNRKAYLSLMAGILTAVFLAAATSLCAWGTIRGHEEQMARRVGWMDMFLMGNSNVTDDQLRSTPFFRDIGHVTVNATVEGSTVCTGWYDETAEKLMSRILAEGRMPVKAGEAAVERSALSHIGHEGAAVGDTMTLSMRPIYGNVEEKTFTIVGILEEQTYNLRTFQEGEGMCFPAMLVTPEDTYRTGTSLVHRVMTYVPLMTLNQVHRHAREYISGGLYDAVGVSRETGSAVYNDSGWARARETVNRVLIWVVLGAALLLSACIGITSAMESLLSRKTEDIGMLRAIGATRRQIRRIYGAEAWMLTATALPAGLLLGILTAWIVSRIAPDQVAFSLNFWLLVPILGMSALCVFIGSRLPLYHASRQMPMGVLRDTALLRRAGKIRNHRMFKPDSLIAGRRIRLHPLRQAGAVCMVALTLISTLMLGELAMGLNDRNEKEQPDFQLWGPGNAVIADEIFAQPIMPEEMSRDGLHRIASVPGVGKVINVTEMRANLILEEVPEYFRTYPYSYNYDDGSKAMMYLGVLNGIIGYTDWLYYSKEDIAEAADLRSEQTDAEFALQAIAQRNLIRAQTGISENIVPVHVFVADLDADALQEYVTAGTIDPDRLDSGEQVLVYAPTICATKRGNSGYIVDAWKYPSQVREEDWDIVIHNDFFTPGLPLKMFELAGEAKASDYYSMPGMDWKNYYRSMETILADTEVGAILSGPARIGNCYMSSFAVIISSKGAEALGLKIPGPSYVDIYLSGNPLPAEEAEIESQVKQIALPSWMTVENRLALNREYMAKKYRQMLLFTALILVFAAVSVAMQVSSATRRIRAETKTIGTLRAVGADLRTLVGCYRLPVWISAGIALIPCLLMYAVKDIPALRLFTKYHPGIVIPALAALASFMALICVAGIRRRLAGVTRQSIVDNIREL